MSIVKSLSVGYGDMFYIRHDSESFTVIDCCMNDENKDSIIDQIKQASKDKQIQRFISTHPDEDHLQGLKYLNENWEIRNFYCVKNEAIKTEGETEDFKFYCALRDSKTAYYIVKNCHRKWLNIEDDTYGSAGFQILWPDINDKDFQSALTLVKQGKGFNNISPVFVYRGASVKVMWMGDMEQDFLEKVKDQIEWPQIDILFAPHHGRKSGKIPEDILEKLNPYIIVIGEAPSENLDYYSKYHTITQNRAGDIIFDCQEKKIDVYVSNELYECTGNFLNDNAIGKIGYGKHLGYFVPKGVLKQWE